MTDKYLEFLYLQQQMNVLFNALNGIRQQLLQKPKHVLLEAELERIKSDIEIIKPIFESTQALILQEIEEELDVKFKWLKK